MGKPTQARLLELFEDVGDTVRRRINAGSRGKAGTEIRSVGNHGYYRVRVDGRYELVHAILWCMRTGQWPDRVDHEDGDTLNNRASNLRLATHAQNMQNTKLQARNTSGHRGVCRHACGKWQVQINANRKAYWGGLFEDYKAACNYADALRQKLHGAYAGEVCHR